MFVLMFPLLPVGHVAFMWCHVKEISRNKKSLENIGLKNFINIQTISFRMARLNEKGEWIEILLHLQS